MVGSRVQDNTLNLGLLAPTTQRNGETGPRNQDATPPKSCFQHMTPHKILNSYDADAQNFLGKIFIRHMTPRKIISLVRRPMSNPKQGRTLADL